MKIDQPRRIKFAIPSATSRLHAGSADILGISRLSREMPLFLENERLSMFQFRATDIPMAIDKGWVDCGLCGLDAVVETGAEISVLMRFPETSTKIALVGRPDTDGQPFGDSFSVVTEYPVITRSFLGGRYGDLQVWKAHGTCESFAFLDAVDGVVDLVDTGDTLRRNGLVVREVLYETCICLVARQMQETVECNEFLGELKRNVQELIAAARNLQVAQ